MRYALSCNRSLLSFIASMCVVVLAAGCTGVAPGPWKLPEEGAGVTPVQPAATRNVPQISIAPSHVCVLTPEGAVKCWGVNTVGELGSTEAAPAPALDSADTREYAIVSVSNSNHFACTVTEVGGVLCWGDNEFGQLGDDTGIGSQAPVTPVGLPLEVIAVSVGSSHACVLTAAGEIWCWGHNGYGQLGATTPGWYSLVPVQVTILKSRATAISARDFTTCAITETDGVACWGQPLFGSSAGGSESSDEPTLVSIEGLDGVSGVAMNDNHICAITAIGGVKCWGANWYGQIGDGTTTNRFTAVDVVGFTDAVQVVVGSVHSCALTGAGKVWCWGANNYGQLGDGTIEERHAPVEVSGLPSGAVALAAGDFHTCALLANGVVKCWGNNDDGQLGDGTTEAAFTPVTAADMASGVRSISAGSSATCAIAELNRVSCQGQMAHVTAGSSIEDMLRVNAQTVSGIPGRVINVAAALGFTCAVVEDGTLWCWGSNMPTVDGYTAGRGGAPMAVPGLTGLTTVSSGGASVCVLSRAGGVQCWGDNGSGQLGDGTTTPRTTPVAVAGLDHVTALSSGSLYSCALTAAGNVRCWGNNEFGQLGDGTTITRTVPFEVVGLEAGVNAISAGMFHACALMIDSSVKCWGNNSHGQVGDGTTETRTSAVAVKGLKHGVRAIAAGGVLTCALMETGGVQCWGDQASGEATTTPQFIFGLEQGIEAIGVGFLNACAVRNTGRMECWGPLLFCAMVGPMPGLCFDGPYEVGGFGDVETSRKVEGRDDAPETTPRGDAAGNGT